MKAEVNEKDVVKHWGIWNKKTEDWYSPLGVLYAVTCPRVANVQHDVMLRKKIGFDGAYTHNDLEVRIVS